jgi:hypothetical protein
MAELRDSTLISYMISSVKLANRDRLTFPAGRVT